MNDFISLDDAAKRLGITADNLRIRCQRGTIPGAVKIPRPGSHRLVWVVPNDDLDSEHILPETPSSEQICSQPLEPLIRAWLHELKTGLHRDDTRPVGTKSIQSYHMAVESFLMPPENTTDKKQTGKRFPREIASLNSLNLRTFFATVPLDKQQKDRYAYKYRIYVGVMSFCDFLARKKILSLDALTLLKKSKPKRVHDRVRSKLTEPQFFEIINALDKYYARSSNARYQSALTKSILYTLAFSGLRRAELLALTLNSIDLERNVIIVLDGKNHKNREVGLMPILKTQLQQWIGVRASGSNAFFTSLNGQPLTESAFNLRMRRLANTLHMEFSAHTFRRFFASVLTNNNVPPTMVQLLLGHSDLKTTQLYIQTDANAANRLMQNFSLNQEAPPPPINRVRRFKSTPPPPAPQSNWWDIPL
jgi:integrase